MVGGYKHEFIYCKILESNHSVATFAPLMGVTAEILSSQLSGAIPFTQGDLMRIRRLLFPDKTLCEMMKFIAQSDILDIVA